MNRHIFALFVPGLREQLATDARTLIVREARLITRVHVVLRLQVGDSLILFDRYLQATGVLATISKKEMTFSLGELVPHVPLSPHITVLLPLLKRDDFEQALYACVELGANRICLLKTEKTQRSEKQITMERCQQILMSAAEQSKNFMIPELILPTSLQAALSDPRVRLYPLLYFDVTGKAVAQLLPTMQAYAQQENITLLIGPEGDLLPAEKEMVREAGALFCRLTPTVLRSVQALSVGLGLVRSLLAR